MGGIHFLLLESRALVLYPYIACETSSSLNLHLPTDGLVRVVGILGQERAWKVMVVHVT